MNKIDPRGEEDFETDKKLRKINSTPFFGSSTYRDWFIDYQIERNISKDPKALKYGFDLIKHNKMKSTYGKDFCDWAVKNLKKVRNPKKESKQEDAQPFDIAEETL